MKMFVCPAESPGHLSIDCIGPVGALEINTVIAAICFIVNVEQMTYKKGRSGRLIDQLPAPSLFPITITPSLTGDNVVTCRRYRCPSRHYRRPSRRYRRPTPVLSPSNTGIIAVHPGVIAVHPRHYRYPPALSLLRHYIAISPRSNCPQDNINVMGPRRFAPAVQKNIGYDGVIFTLFKRSS